MIAFCGVALVVERDLTGPFLGSRVTLWLRGFCKGTLKGPSSDEDDPSLICLSMSLTLKLTADWLCPSSSTGRAPNGMFEFCLSNSAMIFSLMASISSMFVFVGAAAFSGASWATATEGVSRKVSASASTISTKSTVCVSPVSFTRLSLLLIISFRLLFFSLYSSFLLL